MHGVQMALPLPKPYRGMYGSLAATGLFSLLQLAWRTVVIQHRKQYTICSLALSKTYIRRPKNELPESHNSMWSPLLTACVTTIRTEAFPHYGAWPIGQTPWISKLFQTQQQNKGSCVYCTPQALWHNTTSLAETDPPKLVSFSKKPLFSALG